MEQLAKEEALLKRMEERFESDENDDSVLGNKINLFFQSAYRY